MLRKIANRLRAPELASAFNWFVREWQAGRRAAAEAKHRAELEKLAGDHAGMSQVC